MSLLRRSSASLRSVSLALKPTKKSVQSKLFSNSRSNVTSSSSSERRISLISRLPMDSTSCLVSMLPLHSAIAAARLKSVLSAESQSWGWIPQGLAMPL